MKRTRKNMYRLSIFKANIISFIAYIIGAAASMMFLICIDAGAGFAVIFPPLLGFIVASPIILREEEISNHFKKKLRKLELEEKDH